MTPAVTALVLRMLGLCYGFMFAMAAANVAACELREPGSCGATWTQGFTVAGGAATTLLAYLTDSPRQEGGSSRRRRNDPPQT